MSSRPPLSSAMKVAGSCVLVLLLLATLGGISGAFGASASPLSATPLSPSSAPTPASLNRPGGETLPSVPPGSPRQPNLTPMPAPAPTNHYAGRVENSSLVTQPAALSGSRRSISRFTTA